MLTEFNKIILNEASATRTEDFIVKSSLNLISLKMRKYTQKLQIQLHKSKQEQQVSKRTSSVSFTNRFVARHISIFTARIKWWKTNASSLSSGENRSENHTNQTYVSLLHTTISNAKSSKWGILDFTNQKYTLIFLFLI